MTITKYVKQRQVVAIYPHHYKVVFTDEDNQKVREFAQKNRGGLKKNGAIRVITNTGFYEKKCIHL